MPKMVTIQNFFKPSSKDLKFSLNLISIDEFKIFLFFLTVVVRKSFYLKGSDGQNSEKLSKFIYLKKQNWENLTKNPNKNFSSAQDKGTRITVILNAQKQ